MLFWKNERITPAQIIIIGFFLLILGGAFLLMLPVATRVPGGASFFDALFTATSATCVTGLVVQDTAQYWSVFGQAVILALIQIGGMGVVTMAVAIAMFAGKKIGLKQRWVMQESIAAPQVGGIVRMTGFILKAAFLMEGVAAIFLALRFIPQMGFLRGVWNAVFHAVSAFCNAGFDLMGTPGAPYVSLTGYISDPLVNCIIAGLIVLGGIGFMTWHDVYEHRWHFRAYRLQSKVILVTTLALLLFGAVFFYFYEFAQPQWQGLTQKERILAALFQSVTPRTAGFNTVELPLLSQPAQFLVIVLMVIGGSPGSTAGGFKTTTLSVLLLTVLAVFRHKDNTQCYGRRISAEAVRAAVTIFMLYLLLFLTGGVLICCIDGVPLGAAMFETASAIGTVGLSLGITPDLSLPSQLILMFLMYFGRVGGLTLVYALVSGGTPSPALLPQEKIIVG